MSAPDGNVNAEQERLDVGTSGAAALCRPASALLPFISLFLLGQQPHPLTYRQAHNRPPAVVGRGHSWCRGL